MRARSTLAAAFLAALAQSALAQPAETVFEDLAAARDRLLGQTQPVLVTFNAGQTFTFEHDLDDSGSVSIARSQLSAVVGWRTTDQLVLGLDVGGEYSAYDFDDVSDFGGDPLSDALSVQIAPTARWAIDDRWIVTIIGSLKWSGDTDADVGDSFTGGGFASAGYRFSDDFTLGFGLGATSRLEDDARVVPLIFVRWAINDRLTLVTDGPGVRLIAALDDQWSLSVGGRWESREYRLADDAPAPEGVLRDERVAVAVEAVWRPSRAFELAFGGGVDVYNNYELLDSGGDEINDQDGDPAPFIGARLRFSF